MLADPTSTIIQYFEVADSSANAIWLWFGIALAITTAVILAFEVIRRQKWSRRVLYTRCETDTESAPNVPTAWFAWVWVALATDEKWIIENVGLDGTMLLRFLRMCFLLSSILSVLIVPILVPLSFYSDPQDTTLANTTVNSSTTSVIFQPLAMTQFSISNVPEQSNVLFAHAVFLWIVTGLVCAVSYREFRHYAALCTTALRDGGAPDAAYRLPRSEALRYRTVLLQHVPNSLRNDEALKAYFTSLHVGEVEFVALDRIAGTKLSQLANERKRLVSILESAYMDWVIAVDSERWRRMGKKLRAIRHTRRDLIDLHSAPPDWDLSGLEHEVFERLRPRLLDRSSFPPKMVDAIDYWSMKLTSVTSQIRQQRLLVNYPETSICTGSGFVTFKNQRAAHIVSQVLVHGSNNPFSLSIQLAPSPSDVDWHSISIPWYRQRIQYYIVQAAAFTMTFFFFVPSAAVSSLKDVSTLAKLPGFADFATNLSQRKETLFLVENVVPPLLTKALSSIVPYILEYLTSYEGLPSYSAQEMSVHAKYFTHLIINVLFVFTLTTAIFEFVTAFINSPVSILTNVAATLPSGATFFTNYTILGIIGLQLELIRCWTFLVYSIRKLLVKTPRQVHDLNLLTSYVNYGTVYPPYLITFIIVLVYAVISPLILIVSTCFFGIAFLYTKNQVLFVYVKEYEANGRHWVMAFNRIILGGLIITQITLIGMLSLKRAAAASSMCIPLIPLTIIFRYYCIQTFEKRTTHVPLDMHHPPSAIAPPGAAHPSMDVLLDPRTDVPPSPEIKSPKSATKRPGKNERPRQTPEGLPRLNNKDIPAASDDAVYSHEQHIRDRRALNYVNPILSQALPRPWLPVCIADRSHKRHRRNENLILTERTSSASINNITGRTTSAGNIPTTQPDIQIIISARSAPLQDIELSHVESDWVITREEEVIDKADVPVDFQDEVMPALLLPRDESDVSIPVSLDESLGGEVFNNTGGRFSSIDKLFSEKP
ncbi:hypothetical protein SeMB42_g03287 [Synchytrium endobioticum]|uniref:CSC1/OSCA1-like 7TM region domain-containing protein n=1 Tax=Synchytrium endobioticum TaxID=286115 RepID=A0A507D7W9_9FUNG|nr:hypothetical protein SeMB42_g03287 [Synchytrium endobioticum]TPX51113.1 hypothetical protein SeLEV6574_g00501 [Synchytrium endobioticum]